MGQLTDKQLAAYHRRLLTLITKVEAHRKWIAQHALESYFAASEVECCNTVLGLLATSRNTIEYGEVREVEMDGPEANAHWAADRGLDALKREISGG